MDQTSPNAGGPGVPHALPITKASTQPSTGLTWPLSAIKRRPVQIRNNFSKEGLDRLVASIKDNGVLAPLLIDKEGWLIAGHRRAQAAELAGVVEVPVKIVEGDLSETQIVLLQWTENSEREDITGFEQWQTAEKLLILNPTWSKAELAKHLRVDDSMVTRLLSPSRCIVAAQDALAGGKLGISDCYCLSKHNPDEQERLLALKLGGGASRDDLERHGRKARNDASPKVRVSRVKILLPGGGTVVVSAEELGMAELVEMLAEVLKVARKAAEQFDIKTFERMMRDKSKGGES